MKSDSRSPAGDLLNDLAVQVSVAAVEAFGVSEEAADALGTDVAMRMIEQWGGQQLYMPKGVRIEASRLHHQIYQEWRGRNHRELARKYGFSLQFIYRVIKALRKADLDSRQRDMFSPASND
ncbi:Mor transcription activator family protein [Pseudomonas sp. BN515]|uniref:Mor transcription activator family protein n=1 Tax=Pseudomonas sp. BN515 TaxID=2567892 RepID=UPI002455B863|nr:Mor transcription activator family protein [Pseudomonas sp. BN515]MDH4869847.1 DNA-binding protein [Pseudomonas sp. BN515]